MIVQKSCSSSLVGLVRGPNTEARLENKNRKSKNQYMEKLNHHLLQIICSKDSVSPHHTNQSWSYSLFNILKPQVFVKKPDKTVPVLNTTINVQRCLQQSDFPYIFLTFLSQRVYSFMTWDASLFWNTQLMLQTTVIDLKFYQAWHE